MFFILFCFWGFICFSSKNVLTSSTNPKSPRAVTITDGESDIRPGGTDTHDEEVRPTPRRVSVTREGRRSMNHPKEVRGSGGRDGVQHGRGPTSLLKVNLELTTVNTCEH